MIKPFLKSLALVARFIALTDDEVRQIRNELYQLFTDRNIPFTTDTLKAFDLGMLRTYLRPDAKYDTRLLAALSRIIFEREQVEARTNI